MNDFLVIHASKVFATVRALHRLQKHFPLGALTYCFYVQNKCKFSDGHNASEVVIMTKEKMLQMKDKLEEKFYSQVEKARKAAKALIQTVKDCIALAGIAIGQDDTNVTIKREEKEASKEISKVAVTRQVVTVDKTQTKISTEGKEPVKRSFGTDGTQNEETEGSFIKYAHEKGSITEKEFAASVTNKVQNTKKTEKKELTQKH